jgi:hypothetical protein
LLAAERFAANSISVVVGKNDVLQQETRTGREEGTLECPGSLALLARVMLRVVTPANGWPRLRSSAQAAQIDATMLEMGVSSFDAPLAPINSLAFVARYDVILIEH